MTNAQYVSPTKILNIFDNFPILTTNIFIQAVAACSRILNFTSEDVLLTISYTYYVRV